MEKSVSFGGRRNGAKDVLWKGELGDSSDFLEIVESMTEMTSNLELKLSITTELIHFLQ